MPKVGIIGGSGLYEVEGLKNARWETVETPFGEPSDQYMLAELSGAEVVFLPRHGRGHRIMPTELNYPANIYGMKKVNPGQLNTNGKKMENGMYLKLKLN